jgi:hypothetical protein
MKTRLSLVVSMLFLAWGLTGCFDNNPSDSGDGGGTPQDKEQSQKLTASADSVLSAMLAQTGGQNPITGMTSDLKTADGMYRDAAGKDPSNSTANFGAALTGFEILLENNDLKTILQQLESWNSTVTDPNDPRYILSHYFMFGESTIQINDAPYSYDYTLNPANAFAALVSLVQGSLSNPDLVALLQITIDSTVIPQLDRSITYIEKVLGDNSFQMTLTDSLTNVEIDLGEANLLSGTMHLLRGGLKMINAYQLSVPGATGLLDYQNPLAILPLVKSQDINGGNFLKLRNNKMLPAAKTDFLDANDQIKRGISFIKSETDDQTNDLITSEMIAKADSTIQANIDDTIPIPALNQAKNVTALLDGLTSMLNGTFTVDAGTGTASESVTVNLSAFLNNGIPDFKRVIPYHTWANLDTMTVQFTGSDIEETDLQIGGTNQNFYSVEVLNTYANIVGASQTSNHFKGTFSADGAFNITGWAIYNSGDMIIQNLSANAPILDNGAFYLDSQNRLSMTAGAWQTLQTYALTHPNLYFDRVVDGMTVNFSAADPFGVRSSSDSVFRFAGTPNYYDSYINSDNFNLLFLSTAANSGVKVNTPVFPDPTFGGVLPGMTQSRLQSLISEPPA